jgi:hypothetical protein
MWINKFGFIAINQKSPKDITEGILLLAENLNTKLCFGFCRRFPAWLGLFKKAEIRLSEIGQRIRPTRPCRWSILISILME